MLAQAIHSSDSEQFESALQAALNYATTWHDTRGRAEAAWQLGLLRLKQGDRAQAQTLMSELVDYRRDIGHVQAEESEIQMNTLLSSSGSRPSSSVAPSPTVESNNIGPMPVAKRAQKKAVKKRSKK